MNGNGYDGFGQCSGGEIHFRHYFADGLYEGKHVRLKNMPDIADAKCLGLADLAGINYETFCRQPPVKPGEFKTPVFRKMKRRDDATLNCRRQIWLEPQPHHACDQGGMILLITRSARSDSTFINEFFQGLLKSQQRVRGRRVAELAVPLKTSQLIGKIQTERAGVFFVGQQHGTPGQHETKSWNTFECLVGRRNKKIYACVIKSDWDSAEAAHGVHDKKTAMFFGQFTGPVNWVQDAGGGFAMNSGDVGDARVRGQHFIEHYQV